MAQTVVNMHEAKTRLSQLVARAQKGERITLARAGKPAALLVPLPDGHKKPLPPDDPLLHLDEAGFDGPGGKLSNREIDALVYGL
jgi:prevent-host-death family protein